MTLSMGFRSLVSLLPAIQATRLLAFALAGLSPAERASLRWTHTCKHLQINPFVYLRDVIERVSTIRRGWSWS